MPAAAATTATHAPQDGTLRLLPVAREATEIDDDESTGAGPVIGEGDAEADAARSGADADQTTARHDSDGVPVGRDDVEADRRASGA